MKLLLSVSGSQQSVRERPVSEWTLDDISEKLRDIDFAMLLTHTESGEIAGRPMSNNRDVEYDGDSYFFTSEQTRTVADLERDRKVALSYRGREGLFGKPPVFITVQGELTRTSSGRIGQRTSSVGLKMALRRLVSF
jgi:general stress protein 26